MIQIEFKNGRILMNGEEADIEVNSTTQEVRLTTADTSEVFKASELYDVLLPDLTIEMLCLLEALRLEYEQDEREIKASLEVCSSTIQLPMFEYCAWKLENKKFCKRRTTTAKMVDDPRREKRMVLFPICEEHQNISDERKGEGLVYYPVKPE